MDVQRALAQVAEIHGQLAKTQVYRGYRSTPMALTGFLAMIACWLQPRFVPVGDTYRYAEFWVVVAAASILLVAGELTWEYFSGMATGDRRITGRVVGQFLPSLAGGGLVTLALAATSVHVPLLPGLWAVLFSLGIFASRPYLPQGVGWVGLFYLVAGAVLLALAPSGGSLAPWGMGTTFGLGQLYLGLVLYWNLERRTDG